MYSLAEPDSHSVGVKYSGTLCKAAIYCMLVSHHELFQKFVRAGGQVGIITVALFANRKEVRLLDSRGHAPSKRSKVWG